VLVGAVSALLVYAAVVAAGGLSDAYEQLRTADGWWMFPAVVAISLRYVFLGMQLRRLRGEADIDSTRVTVGVALVTFGLGGVLPASPAEGIALSVVELRRRGIPARQSGLMLAASQWVQFWSLIVVFAVDRVLVAALNQIRGLHTGWATATSVLLLAIVVAAIVMTRRESVFRRLALATKWVPGQRRKSRDELMAEGVTIQHELVTSFGPVPNRLAVGLLTLSAIVLDATVMWCALAATYGPITFEVVVLAYTVAMVVTWVPLLPSGLGLVEFVVPLVLHRFGVPVATGLAGVLLWRAVSLFLPALAGLGVYGTLRVRRNR